jgi:anti-sigma regulatory factor (Ser/Thr protein kinase)
MDAAVLDDRRSADRAAARAPLAVIAAIWLAPGVVAGLLLYRAYADQSATISLARTLTWQVLGWQTWTLWTPIVFAIARQWPIQRGGLTRAIPVHAVSAAAVSVLQCAAIAALQRTFGPSGATRGQAFAAAWWDAILLFGDWQLGLYGAVLAAGTALEFHRRLREGEVAAERLRSDVARAQLQALRAQVNPHFLFNALNAACSLVEKDPPAAQKMLVRLADLLRMPLASGPDQEIPLEREIASTTKYLEIEQVRFGDRLTVVVDVPADLGDALVPTLLLQPLVENAIRHGTSPKPGPGRIAVRVRAQGEAMVLEVTDDGVGFDPTSPASQPGHGIGLTNTRARLERLYGVQQSFTIAGARGEGCTVTVRLPLRFIGARTPPGGVTRAPLPPATVAAGAGVQPVARGPAPAPPLPLTETRRPSAAR